MANRPTDITLPAGWTWERVEAARTRWGIANHMVPIATAPGVAAWGTIASARAERNAHVAAPLRTILNAFSPEVPK